MKNVNLFVIVFQTHTTAEHNFANYLFFLTHLLNKPDTEHTGQVCFIENFISMGFFFRLLKQESYVWEMYQSRKWDFFPIGECFRRQYESGSGGSGTTNEN